jgi:UDP-glucose 4-epimerase
MNTVMKVVVTGANGFIGSWLCRELSKNGSYIIAVIREENSGITALENVPNIKIVYCRMEELGQLPEKINERGFDVFYHLAWTGSTGADRADFALQLKNAGQTVEAVRAAHSLGCRRFIGAGTLAELDCYSYIIEDGSKPLPVSGYGIAKIAAHFMSKAECSRLGVEHIWAYLSNNYGEGNRTQNFVNFAAGLMLSGKRASFTKGEQLYDFVHVSDTARGLYLLGEKGRAFCSYYIGSTKPAKLREFIYKIRDAVDPSIELHLGEVPFNGVMQPESVFDCSKLVRDTGYSPSVAFEEGIANTVEWLKEIGWKG